MRRKLLLKLRDFYCSTSFFNQPFDQVISPLINSFVPHKGVPLDLEEPTDYYTSTTATALLALHHMRVLDSDIRNEFYETLFWLRDHTLNAVVKAKSPEDEVAWDVSESASVWATSLALWALVGTGYKGERVRELVAATTWLVDQQRSNGGWGFDKESPSRIYFTALALHALRLAIKTLPLSSSDVGRLNRSRQYAFRFILRKCEKHGKVAYWRTRINEKDEADATSTLYAIWVLHEEGPKRHSQIIKAGIEFLRREMKDETWQFRTFIQETETKYSTQKIIVSYTPSFLIPLLTIGVSPLEDICLKPLIWLKKNRIEGGWLLPGHSQHALSFTTAYALWTITQWHRYALRYVVREEESQPSILRGVRKRITVLIGTVIAMTIAWLTTNTRLAVFLGQSVSGFYSRYGIEGLASLIASIITIGGLIKYLDSRILEKRISRGIGKLGNAIRHWVYLS